MMKLNLLASKKLMKLWVVLGVLIVLLSLVAAKSGGGGGRIGGGGGFGRGSTRGGAGSGRHVTGGGGHSRDEATPDAADAWISLSLVAARGGAGGGHGGHSGGHGSCGGHRSTRGRGVLGAGSHRRGNEASTPSGANAWLSWSLGFFALILVEIVLRGFGASWQTWWWFWRQTRCSWWPRKYYFGSRQLSWRWWCSRKVAKLPQMLRMHGSIFIISWFSKSILGKL
ncbi:hypothetical protein LWI28_024500 [Acer negundo]|uniref:Uncharacterized protein n=1 Tax=Acer negundo TaxID=4023 RepID=A0AAD5P2W6_ACENE|nr:hypothetical protein LWI28_024500 [Acer negundo]